MSDLMEEEIEDNREVCSNCFRKVLIVIPKEERTPANASSNIEAMVSDGRYPNDGAEVCYPTVTGRNQSSTGIACECGVIDHDTKLRPLKKERVMENAKRLTDRLEEHEYSVDDTLFLDIVRDMKEDPANQFDDREIFTTAIEFSVDYEEEDD